MGDRKKMASEKVHNLTWYGADMPGCDDYIAELKEAVKADGVDLQATNMNAWTGLMCAAMPSQKGPGDLAMVKILVEAKANVNFANDDEFTALNAAANRGQTDICKYLIEQKADVNHKCQGKTVLQMCQTNCPATETGKADTIALLKKNVASDGGCCTVS